MKSLKLALFMVIGTLAIIWTQSCSNPCQNTVCLNRGICIDGTCECLSGFSGDSCQNVTPCLDVICLNNGVCETGVCNCPPGFYGDRCQNETVQSQLDRGETPLAIFRANFPLDSIYGKFYLGGVIFFVDTDELYDGIEGFVAAIEDQSTGTEWGCLNSNIANLEDVTSCADNCEQPEPEETVSGTRVGDGPRNTSAILAGCSEDAIAAKLCRDLGSVWFLPSRGELTLMSLTLCSNDFGDCMGVTYWSSTEFNEDRAWRHFMGNGYHDVDNKDGIAHVRAIRAF
ncbi:MAG: hypothetical protein AAF985_24990 [Bacteroidota bacterium]